LAHKGLTETRAKRVLRDLVEVSARKDLPDMLEKIWEPELLELWAPKAPEAQLAAKVLPEVTAKPVAKASTVFVAQLVIEATLAHKAQLVLRGLRVPMVWPVVKVRTEILALPVQLVLSAHKAHGALLVLGGRLVQMETLAEKETRVLVVVLVLRVKQEQKAQPVLRVLLARSVLVVRLETKVLRDKSAKLVRWGRRVLSV